MSATGVPSEASMCRHVTVSDPLGLHARPAALLARTASAFAADISILHGRAAANAKSVMGVLMLCARQGACLAISAEGADAAEAMQAILALFPKRVPVAEAIADTTHRAGQPAVLAPALPGVTAEAT